MVAIVNMEMIHDQFCEIDLRKYDHTTGSRHRYLVDIPTTAVPADGFNPDVHNTLLHPTVMVAELSVSNLAYGLLTTSAMYRHQYHALRLLAVGVFVKIGGLELTYEYEVIDGADYQWR